MEEAHVTDLYGISSNPPFGTSDIPLRYGATFAAPTGHFLGFVPRVRSEGVVRRLVVLDHRSPMYSLSYRKGSIQIVIVRIFPEGRA